jgi:hypothetical protein
MPLHVYAPERTPCRLCGEGFEHAAAATEPELTACPTCGQAVTRQPAQNIRVPKLSTPPGVSRAKQAGFAVLKRTCDGGFEPQ